MEFFKTFDWKKYHEEYSQSRRKPSHCVRRLWQKGHKMYQSHAIHRVSHSDQDQQCLQHQRHPIHQWHLLSMPQVAVCIKERRRHAGDRPWKMEQHQLCRVPSSNAINAMLLLNLQMARFTESNLEEAAQVDLPRKMNEEPGAAEARFKKIKTKT